METVGGFFSEARLELGGVLTKHEVVVPDSQRFRAGGEDSVRGYDYRTLAPATPEGGVTGGKLLFTASAEIAQIGMVETAHIKVAVFKGGILKIVVRKVFSFKNEIGF